LLLALDGGRAFAEPWAMRRTRSTLRGWSSWTPSRRRPSMQRDTTVSDVCLDR